MDCAAVTSFRGFLSYGAGDAFSACVFNSAFITCVWWGLLTLNSIVNCRTVWHLFGRDKTHDSTESPKLKNCAFVYIAACSLRTIWPRRDGQRTCFWDSWLSYPLIGRVAATAAEICFAYQLVLCLSSLAKQLKCRRVKAALKVVVPAIAIAQCSCWMSVSTRNQWFHVFEESIWLLVMQLCGTCALVLALQIKDKEPSSVAGRARLSLLAGFGVSVVFTVFLWTSDIPMYVSRALEDEGNAVKYLGVLDGLADMASCHTVDKHFDVWRQEMPWRTGYFVGATSLSLQLTQVPVLREADANRKQQ